MAEAFLCLPACPFGVTSCWAATVPAPALTTSVTSPTTLALEPGGHCFPVLLIPRCLTEVDIVWTLLNLWE